MYNDDLISAFAKAIKDDPWFIENKIEITNKLFKNRIDSCDESIENNDNESETNKFHLFYSNIHITQNTMRYISRYLDGYRHNNCLIMDHNKKLTDIINGSYFRRMKIFNVNPYFKPINKYKNLKWCSDIPMHVISFGEKIYPIAAIAYTTMTLFIFDNNFDSFLKEDSFIVNDSLRKMLRCYYGLLKDFSVVSQEYFDQDKYTNKIMNLICDLSTNVNNENEPCAFVKKEYNTEEIKNYVTNLVERIMLEYNSKIGTYCNVDINTVKYRYYSIINDLQTSYQYKLKNEKLNAFRTGFKLPIIMEKCGWKLLDSNSDEFYNNRHRQNNNYLWKKEINSIPTKVLHGNKLYFIKKNDVTKKIIDEYTIKNLYIDENFSVYSDNKIHPHSSSGKMCIGDLVFNINDESSFIKTLNSLHHMYETINYGSAYNHNHESILMSHATENAVETLGLDEVKDLHNQSSTLEKII
jgi:hypothetical protein